jgi:hypothetical protein
VGLNLKLRCKNNLEKFLIYKISSIFAFAKSLLGRIKAITQDFGSWNIGSIPIRASMESIAVRNVNAT